MTDAALQATKKPKVYLPGSTHFTEAEFRCPISKKVRVAPALVEALEQLRKLHGAPIFISRFGGCRSLKANKIAGGTAGSCHLIETAEGEPIDCRAADVSLSGLTPRQALQLVVQVPGFRDGGIGYYPKEGFLHVDVRDTRARWARLERGHPYVAIPAGILPAGA